MRKTLFLGTIGIFLFSIGCSKKNDAGKPTTTSQGDSTQVDSIHVDSSLVASISTSDGNAYYFSYDNEGRVTKILYTQDTSSYTKIFQYNNQQIIASALDQRGNITIDTLQLNADTSLRSDVSVAGTTTSKYTYAYSNGELDTAYIPNTNNQLNLHPAISYSWQNGDCASYVEVGVFFILGFPPPVSTLAYYDNQPAQPIDRFRLSEYETYGNATFTIKTAHMAQSYTYTLIEDYVSYPSTVYYTYVFDTKGRVSGIQDSGSDNIVTTITYE